MVSLEWLEDMAKKIPLSFTIVRWRLHGPFCSLRFELLSPTAKKTGKMSRVPEHARCEKRSRHDG
jgi:hypothetical protein